MVIEWRSGLTGIDEVRIELSILRLSVTRVKGGNGEAGSLSKAMPTSCPGAGRTTTNMNSVDSERRCCRRLHDTPYRGLVREGLESDLTAKLRGRQQ